jgi:2-polyprenyl-6-hydroxyphenyl methylase/3-demethylubiquinone-9 3-methyltransferase
MKEDLSESLLEYALNRLSIDRSSSGVACKICGEVTQLFDVVDFKKSCDRALYPDGLSGIPVFYRSCPSCKFIFTSFFDAFTTEQWRTYVYNDYYAVVDPEYLEIRPRRNVSEIESLLTGDQNVTIGLDFGGGNGTTAKLLRQKGWTYDSYDPFGLSDVKPEAIGQYNFCSTFEVFEHSPDPVSTLSEIIRMTSPGKLMILVGTAAHDSFVRPDSRLTWWYAGPRNGHISLYSHRALQLLGERFGLSYVSISAGTHLLLRGIAVPEARRALLKSKVMQRARRALGRA